MVCPLLFPINAEYLQCYLLSVDILSAEIHDKYMNNNRQILLCSFGLNLKKKRENLGVSQEYFAEICGLDRTYISMLETGKRNPSLINLMKVSNGLNISLSNLLDGVYTR